MLLPATPHRGVSHAGAGWPSISTKHARTGRCRAEARTFQPEVVAECVESGRIRTRLELRFDPLTVSRRGSARALTSSGKKIPLYTPVLVDLRPKGHDFAPLLMSCSMNFPNQQTSCTSEQRPAWQYLHSGSSDFPDFGVQMIHDRFRRDTGPIIPSQITAS